MLGVVTCHFNPCGWERPVANYWQWRQLLSEQFCGDIVTVELVFGSEPVVDDAIHIYGDHRHVMWQKERLLNIGIRALPADVDYVAWIDADLLFLNPHWAEQTVELLQKYAAVQLFGHCHFTDREGRITAHRKSFAHIHQHGRVQREWFSPGGAWATRREHLQHGLYDADIIGGGDTSIVEAWGGDQGPYAIYERRYQRMPASLKRYREWAEKQTVAGSIGYVPGDVIHLWHGDREKRDYTGRYEILAKHNFSLDLDVRIGVSNVWEWCTEKPELQAAIRKYFYRREEDGA